MTSPEAARLIRVEERQKEMTVHIAALTLALKENTVATAAIKQALDELTGAKKILVWIVGIVVAGLTAAGTLIGVHHK